MKLGWRTSQLVIPSYDIHEERHGARRSDIGISLRPGKPRHALGRFLDVGVRIERLGPRVPVVMAKIGNIHGLAGSSHLDERCRAISLHN